MNKPQLNTMDAYETGWDEVDVKSTAKMSQLKLLRYSGQFAEIINGPYKIIEQIARLTIFRHVKSMNLTI